MPVFYLLGISPWEFFEGALDFWYRCMGVFAELLSMSLEEWGGSSVTLVLNNVFDVLQPIGLSLVVMFSFIGLTSSTSSIVEFKRPEVVFKVLFRIFLSAAAVTHARDISEFLFGVGRLLVLSIFDHFEDFKDLGFARSPVPEDIVEDLSKGISLDLTSVLNLLLLFFAALAIYAFSVYLILVLYQRFFKIVLYTAISPVSLSFFASQQTQQTGRSWLMSYVGIAFEAVLLLIAFILYWFLMSQNDFWGSSIIDNKGLNYLFTTVLNMLILLVTVRSIDSVAQKVVGY